MLLIYNPRPACSPPPIHTYDIIILNMIHGQHHIASASISNNCFPINPQTTSTCVNFGCFHNPLFRHTLLWTMQTQRCTHIIILLYWRLALIYSVRCPGRGQPRAESWHRFRAGGLHPSPRPCGEIRERLQQRQQTLPLSQSTELHLPCQQELQWVALCDHTPDSHRQEEPGGLNTRQHYKNGEGRELLCTCIIILC